MNRKEIEQKLMEMNFPAANKGFHYIAEALECIYQDNGQIIKLTATYAEIAKRQQVTPSSVERCIRHEISCYYNQRNIHPMLENTDGKFIKRTNREFLARLYRIIYDGQ